MKLAPLLLLILTIKSFAFVNPAYDECLFKLGQINNFIIAISEKQKHGIPFLEDKSRLRNLHFKAVEQCGEKRVKPMSDYMIKKGII